jgi:hypothetical protein
MLKDVIEMVSNVFPCGHPPVDTQFCKCREKWEYLAQAISDYLSKEYVKKGEVRLDGKKLATLLNDQIFSYKNTDDNGEWIGECLDTALALKGGELIR